MVMNEFIDLICTALNRGILTLMASTKVLWRLAESTMHARIRIPTT